MKYIYRIARTEGSIGYAVCEPEGNPPLERLLPALEKNPGDIFLRRHLLALLETLPANQLENLAAEAQARQNAGLAGLLGEFYAARPGAFPASLEAGLPAGAQYFPPDVAEAPGELEDALYANLARHHKIARDVQGQIAGLPAYGEIAGLAASMNAAPPIAGPAGRAAGREPENAEPEALLARAQNALAPFLVGVEQRHEKSLSPIGLLRSFKIAAKTGPECQLEGVGTAYGRGLSLLRARLSLYMEIVERLSAHADILAGAVCGRRQPLPLTVATAQQLAGAPERPVWPNCGKKDWQNVPLAWVRAEDAAGGRVLAPAQAVFLFCNLGEPAIFERHGSSGLAAGGSREFARLAALLEIIERDAAATVPYYAAACFQPLSRDARVQALLADYERQGIIVRLQDITTEIGVPAYRAYVLDRKGNVFQAAAAALDGKKAALAAILEIPWAYAYGRAGLPGMPALGRTRQIWLEDLPNYSVSAAADLALVEERLLALGHPPAYVDLTRADLDLPVCRAIVPGLEARAGLERAAPRRLLARLLNLSARGLV